MGKRTSTYGLPPIAYCIGAGLLGGAAGLVASGFVLLLIDHVLPVLAGVPAPAPWTPSPGLILAVVAAPGLSLYVAGQLCALRAPRTRHVVMAMSVALGLLVASLAVALNVAVHS